jgi:adenylate cyclase
MRVRRSFCFVDVSGFTALTEESGDEQAVSVLTGFRAAVRDVCSRRGVRIAKWLGDGAMLVSVETTPVLCAALELQFRSTRRPVAVRCGMTTGSVILLEGDDYIGHSVNLAARLCDVAAGDEVLASTEMIPFLPPWAAVIESRELALRGLSHTVDVVVLGLAHKGNALEVDPVCGIPLTPEIAACVRGGESGPQILLCSESCLETWLDRIDAESARGEIFRRALPGSPA